jgi:hypothetical protein
VNLTAGFEEQERQRREFLKSLDLAPVFEAARIAASIGASVTETWRVSLAPMLEEARRTQDRFASIARAAMETERKFKEAIRPLVPECPRWIDHLPDFSVPDIAPIDDGEDKDDLRERVAELVREELEKLLSPPPLPPDDRSMPGQYL